MNWQNIPDRPTVHFNLYEHIFTSEHFAIRRQPDTAGTWHITGCLPLPWPAARCIPLELLPYDADKELVEWARTEIRYMDLMG